MSGGELRGSYEFVVIGGGPAGKRAAIQAAKAGHSVLLVDRRASIGGVCLHTGTIPSKTMRETVMNLSGWREREFYGAGYCVKQDITAKDIQTRLRLTIDHEVEVLNDQLGRNNVVCISAHAAFTGPREVKLTYADGTAAVAGFDKALIAVGTRPYRPETIPFDGEAVLDSDDILEIEALPESMIIIGAGVIGIEYATIFNALGISVTVIEPREAMLGFLDNGIVDTFMDMLEDRGVDLKLGCGVKSVERRGERCRVILEDGRSFDADKVLFTGGRVGATDRLGLEACGLEAPRRGLLSVDTKTFQTDIPHIYAAGDVVGFPSLASTSMAQGRVVACHAFDIPMSCQPEYFPYGIYSVPEISTIGLTEAQVKDSGVRYECGAAQLRETSRGQIMGVQSGMMKMIFAVESRKLLGVHIIGEGATELIHIGQAVLNLDGDLNFFIDNIFNYPTLAEAYKIAALDAWNKMEALSDEALNDDGVTDIMMLVHKVEPAAKIKPKSKSSKSRKA